MIWPNDVPPEVSLQMQKAAAPTSKPPQKKPRAKLSSVADTEVRRGRRDSVDGVDGDARKPDGDRRPDPARRRMPVPVPVPAEARADGADGDGRATPAAPPPGRKPRRELPPYLRVIK
jgi:hypothetical protein